jgi:hypothetical protein
VRATTVGKARVQQRRLIISRCYLGRWRAVKAIPLDQDRAKGQA